MRCRRHQVVASVLELALTEQFPGERQLLLLFFVLDFVVVVIHFFILLLDLFIVLGIGDIVKVRLSLDFIVSVTVYISVIVVADL